MKRNINQESLLWQRTPCYLTRIETTTINGIPDVQHKQGVFWIELK